jgi:hypothetical protein
MTTKPTEIKTTGAGSGTGDIDDSVNADPGEGARVNRAGPELRRDWTRQTGMGLSRRMRPSEQSIGVRRQDLAPADGAECAPGLIVDRALDGVHTTVGEQSIDSARMVAPRCHCRVGRPTIVLVL